MAFQSTSSSPTLNLTPTTSNTDIPSTTPSATRSTNGQTKNFSMIASKSFFLTGDLDSSILDISVDSGDNTPLDQGTRSIRFMSAATSLMEHFSPSPLRKGLETDPTAPLTQASFTRLETEPMTPPPISPPSTPTSSHPAFHLPHTNHIKPTTGLALDASPLTLPGDATTSDDIGGVAPGNFTIPDYSIDEITPNPIPATKPPHTSASPLMNAPITPDTVLSPRFDASLHGAFMQHRQSCGAIRRKRNDMRSKLRDIPVLRKFASRHNGKDSIHSRVPLINKNSSQSGPAKSRNEASAELGEENPLPVQNTTTGENDSGRDDDVDDGSKLKHRLLAVKRRVLKFLHRFKH